MTDADQDGGAAQLLTIGDFARAVGLPASALRHYDECGLLVPAETDPTTGYRYYTPGLERRARLVAMMRDVGVPIATMRAVLDGTPDDARGALAGWTADREQHASRSREVVDTVLALVDEQRSPGLVRLRLDGRVLAAALRQVRVAADREPASALAAVLLDVRGDELDVVATNRHWMACRRLAGTAEVRGDERATLRPGRVGDLAERLERAGDVVVVVSDGRLSVEDDDEVVPVVTGDRPFPAHRIVLDALPAPATRAVVDRDVLLRGLTEAGRSVVRVGIADDALELEGSRDLPAVVSGKPEAVAFRTALLLRAVAACVGQRLLLQLAGPDRAVRVSSPDQPGFVALVMPTLERP